MSYTWASATNIGLVRDINEDSVAPRGMGVEHGSFVIGVADGMGGHVGGEIASRLALEAAMESEGDPVDRVEAANRAVVAAVGADPSLYGMGTTLTLAVFEADQMEIGHIGDSRAYLQRDDELTQLTTDHSLVAELVARGEISAEEAEVHPYRSVITRAIGLEEQIHVDRIRRELRPGDRILLCSDGLTNMIDDDAIADIITSADRPTEAVRSLVETAIEAGGIDNISAIVVHVSGDE